MATYKVTGRGVSVIVQASSPKQAKLKAAFKSKFFGPETRVFVNNSKAVRLR